jgi:uncharacterized small protein (TIGR04563 family)
MASMEKEKQKQSLYFPEDMLREIMRESTRLDRSLSWTVQQAWRVARAELRKFPSVEHGAEAGPERRDADATGGGARQGQPSAQVLEFLRGKFESVTSPPTLDGVGGEPGQSAP